MKNIKIMFSPKIFNIFKWAFLVLIGFFIILVIIRFFNLSDVEKTNNQVLKIHSTKLSMNDVLGDNLPPDPGAAADTTVEGVDFNKNGIRDDVEIAIFKEYPNSAKTRAVLLQYALSLQMETTQPFINEKIVTEIVTEEGRADTCLSETLSPRKDLDSERDYIDIENIDKFINFVEELQINNDARIDAHKNFYTYLRSYGESTNKINCDIDLSELSN